MDDNIAICLDNISKRYKIYNKPADKLKEAIWWTALHKEKSYHRDFWALEGINLEIPKGKTLGIIGQNGSGKSTLLQIIAGILQPTTGSIHVSGRISALLELGTGFNPEFTGRDNVLMQGTIMGIKRMEMEKRFDEIEAFADIGDFIDQPVKTYSSGMYVRLAFAVAINVDPDILIVDEALAVGDAQFVQKCVRKFEQFQEKGITIIFVSHDVNSIKKNCHEVILLDKGEVIDKGDPKEVIDVYNALIFEKIAADIKGEKTFSSKEIASKRINGKSQQYGTREAEILEVSLLDSSEISTKTILSGDQTCIRIKILFKANLENVLVGITIRNRIGIDIYMINTLWKGIKIPPVKENEILIVDFNQSMFLGPDEYFINVGIAQSFPQGIKKIDWISDFFNFNVSTSEKFSGISNLNSNITINTSYVSNIVK